jgi:hypothetical protein
VFNRLVAMTELIWQISFRLQKRSQAGLPGMNHLTLDTVVVPHAFHSRVERFTRLQVQTNNVTFSGFLL